MLWYFNFTTQWNDQGVPIKMGLTQINQNQKHGSRWISGSKLPQV